MGDEHKQYVFLTLFVVNMRIPAGIMAKAIEAFIRTAGGSGNCRFTGRLDKGRPVFRVAERFLPHASHFTFKNLDWDTLITKPFVRLHDGGWRGSRQFERRHDVVKAAILDTPFGSFRYRLVGDNSTSYATVAASKPFKAACKVKVNTAKSHHQSNAIAKSMEENSRVIKRATLFQAFKVKASRLRRLTVLTLHSHLSLLRKPHYASQEGHYAKQTETGTLCVDPTWELNIKKGSAAKVCLKCYGTGHSTFSCRRE